MNSMSVHVDGDKVCITAIGEGDCDDLVQIVIRNQHDGSLLIEAGDDESILMTEPHGHRLVVRTPLSKWDMVP